MRTIGEQAKEFRELMGWGYTRMAEEVSKYTDTPVSRQKITQLEDAGNRRPHYLLALAQAMGTSSDILLAGNFVFEPNGAISAKRTSGKSAAVGTPADLSVPLLSWVRAGDYCEAPGQFAMEDAEEMLPRPLFNTSKNTFALLVRGDSMDTADGYREGEIVYIDPNVSPTPGKDVLAKTDGGMTLKRYKEDEDGPYLLQLNGNKIIRPTGHWHVCGVVVFSGKRR